MFKMWSKDRLSSFFLASHKAQTQESNSEEPSKCGSKNGGQSLVFLLLNRDFSGRSVDTWFHTLIVLLKNWIPHSTNIAALDTHISVDRFESLLHGNVISGSSSHPHVVVDDLGGFRISSMDTGKNRGGKNGSLGFCLLASLPNSNSMGITNSSLDQRNVHQFNDRREGLACVRAVSSGELELSKGEQFENLVVDPCSTLVLSRIRTTSIEVLASLVSQLVKKLSIRSKTILSFDGSCVEANTLVPSMNNIVVAVNASTLTVIHSIFKLTDHVHEDVHVGGSLLDGLTTTVESVFGKVSVTVSEFGGLSAEGGGDPLVGVVIKSVVIVVVQEIGVWASWARHAHSVSSRGGESSDGTSVVVIFARIVRICVLPM